MIPTPQTSLLVPTSFSSARVNPRSSLSLRLERTVGAQTTGCSKARGRTPRAVTLALRGCLCEFWSLAAERTMCRPGITGQRCCQIADPTSFVMHCTEWFCHKTLGWNLASNKGRKGAVRKGSAGGRMPLNAKHDRRNRNRSWPSLSDAVSWERLALDRLKESARREGVSLTNDINFEIPVRNTEVIHKSYWKYADHRRTA